MDPSATPTYSVVRPCAWLVAVAIVAGASHPTAAQEGVATVVFDAGQTLRGLAAEHLGDPDLWSEILRFNDLTSAAELTPGQTLRLPVERVARVDAAIRQAATRIGEATAEGARLFAAAEVDQAIADQEAAQVARADYRWDEAERLAAAAAETAVRARDRALEERRTGAEALLTDRVNQVQDRLPIEAVWSDAPLNKVLIEQHRVRTLSESAAQITFRDDSRIRLSANSQAVIERLETDALYREERATVSVAEGDIYALLGAPSSNRRVQIEVPGVETDIESQRFWIGHDDDSVAFANYDDDPLAVTSAGERVVASLDECTRVTIGQAPETPHGLLAAPAGLFPAADQVIRARDVELRWEPIAGAVSYVVQVAPDQQFLTSADVASDVAGTTYRTVPLADGLYYWNVSTVDHSSCPGPAGAPLRFRVQADAYAPYLALQGDVNRVLARLPVLAVVGETESRATVRVNGVAVEVAADGSFRRQLDLSRGANDIEVEATDPAGNSTNLRRTITFLPDTPLTVDYAAAVPRSATGAFVVRGGFVRLRGVTNKPTARLTVQRPDSGLLAATDTGTAGEFDLSVPVPNGVDSLELAVTTGTGQRIAQRLPLERAVGVPRVGLVASPPPATTEQHLILSATVRDAMRASVDGEPLAVTEGPLRINLTLGPGINRREMRAADADGDTAALLVVTTVDVEPPELLETTATRRAGIGGDEIAVRVRARDAHCQAPPPHEPVGDEGHRRSRSEERGAESDHSAEDQAELPEGGCAGERHQSQAGQERAGHHQDSYEAAVQPVADGWTHHSHDEEDDREADSQLGPRGAELLAQRNHEDPKGAEAESERQQLGHEGDADDAPTEEGSGCGQEVD